MGWWCSGDSGCESRAAQEVPGVSAVRRSLIVANWLTRSAAQAVPPSERGVALFWLRSKLDNVVLWESGAGPTLKNCGRSAFSTSSISRQLFDRHDGISVPMAAQPVRLPQRPALVPSWATKLAESLISSFLARFGLQRGSHWRRSSEVAHRSKPERFSHPLSGSASAWFSRTCC